MENRLQDNRHGRRVSGVLVMADNILNITLDANDIKNIESRLMQFSDADINRVKYFAIMKTGAQMITTAKREVTKIYTIPSNKFLHAMTTRIIDRDTGVMTTTGAVFSETDFKYRATSKKARKKTLVKTKSGFARVYQTRWTITSEIKRGEPHVIQDAFMRPVNKSINGSIEKKHIFVRHYDDAADLQLGPSIPVMLSQPGILNRVSERGIKELEKNTQHEITRRLEGWGYKK